MTNHLRLLAATLIFFSASAFSLQQHLHIGPEPFDPQTTSFQALSTSESNGQWVLQFEGLVTESTKVMVEAAGFEIIDYVPDNALLVVGDKSQVRQLQGVRAVVPMQPVWKLSADLQQTHVFNSREIVEASVRTLNNYDLSVKGIRTLRTSGALHVVRAQRQSVVELAELSEVVRVEIIPAMTPFVLPIASEQRDFSEEPSYTGFETGTRIANFDGAWARGFNGNGQKVAVADTGLDMGRVGSLHPDFSAVRKGYKFGLFARDWNDPQGHGTHVAGSVGGNGSASEGRLSGGAYSAEVIPQGMWSPVLNNLTVPTNLSDMFEPAYNDGARAHSNSWGSPRDLGAYTGMSQQVDEFMWNNPEFLILFAAGNSGVDGDKDGRIDEGSVSSPGTAKNALTVGASENYLLEGGVQRTLGELLDGEPWGVEPLASDRLSDDEVGIAAFSSRGPTRDGRLKPELVAPGTNIVSVCSRVDGATKLWGNYNEDYCFAGGTSMSTPITAGGAAVARQFLVEEMRVDRPSAALVKGLLMHSAFNLFPGQYGDRGKSSGQELLVDGPNMHQGFGRLD
ncbi:MAG: S8 family serine peptidase, partial [Pseudomonadota bacterium]